MADLFDKKTWETGETITESDLNRMEDGIEYAVNRTVYVDMLSLPKTYNELVNYAVAEKTVIYAEYRLVSDVYKITIYTLTALDYRDNIYYAVFTTGIVSEEYAVPYTLMYASTDPDEPMGEV